MSVHSDVQPVRREELAERDGAGSAGASLLQVAGIGIVVLLAGVFVFANRSELPAVGRAIRDAQPVFVLAAAALTILFMLNQAAFYAAAYRSVGLSIPFRSMIRIAVGASFLNMISKSGGLGGMAFFVADAGRRGHSRGKVVTAYMLVALLGHLAFALLLGVSLVVVWLDGNLTRAEVIAGLVFTIYVAAQVVVLLAGVRSRAALRRVHAFPALALQRVERLLGREPGPPPDLAEAADELYDAIQVLLRRPSAMAVPALHAILVEAIGVSTIWAVLLAFGQHAGVQVPLVAYGMSVLFSIVGFLPAGLGFAEASMAAVFHAFNIPGAEAAVVVVTYRLFEVWIPFAIGGFVAQGLARRGRRS